MLCINILRQDLCDFSSVLYCVHYCDVEALVVVSVCLSDCLFGSLLYSVFMTNKSGGHHNYYNIDIHRDAEKITCFLLCTTILVLKRNW